LNQGIPCKALEEILQGNVKILPENTTVQVVQTTVSVYLFLESIKGKSVWYVFYMIGYLIPMIPLFVEVIMIS
jgi:hypothetical protein